MAYKIVWTDEALSDIESIGSYIEKDSPFYAELVVNRFFSSAEQLTDFPEMGRIVPEEQDESVRELIVYSYRLMYEIRSSEIYILMVIHCKRDIASIIEDRKLFS